MLLIHHCGSGVVGPLASGMNAFRLASYIRSLQATVLSLGGKRGGTPGLKIDKAWPEIARLAGLDEVPLHVQVDRALARWFED